MEYTEEIKHKKQKKFVLLSYAEFDYDYTASLFQIIF